MCGIIGVISDKPVTHRLVEGLKRLEYRGYDSAGVAVLNGVGVERRRAPGKIAALEAVIAAAPIDGMIGVGHTRWATHGAPNEANAHPHVAGGVALVHNGIIENYRALKTRLADRGHLFETETDTETIAFLLQDALATGKSPQEAMAAAIDQLEGAFAIAAVFEGEDDLMIGARRGSPLIVGLGEGEAFLGSDPIALAPFTDQVVFLEDGDWVVLRRTSFEVFDQSGARVERPVKSVAGSAALVEIGNPRHFMEKEIHEQPEALGHTLATYLDPVAERVRPIEGVDFARLDRVVLTACGTAHYASAIAKYWFEGLAGLPADIDVASEFRYRRPALIRNSLAIAVSQSGETADTRAALELCQEEGLQIGAVVNVPESSIARMSDARFPTNAGPEIGVASTKAFTCQLGVLACLAVSAARARGRIDEDGERALVRVLTETPRRVAEALEMETAARKIAAWLADADDVLYLGRGPFFPLALEAALKLKEISYIHAEGYPAGELKHGPIALIDKVTPVVVIAPTDELFDKTASSVQEVVARGAPVALVTDAEGADKIGDLAKHVIIGPSVDPLIAPIVYAVAAQFLAYHTAVLKGTDVDQPRNLAKSVTVE